MYETRAACDVGRRIMDNGSVVADVSADTAVHHSGGAHTMAGGAPRAP